MKKVIKIFVIIAASLVTFVLSLYLVAYCMGEPDLNKNRYLKLYDDNQDIFYQSINDYAGHYVTLDNVSDYFLESIVAIEDQHFYQHRGFDRRMLYRRQLHYVHLRPHLPARGSGAGL